VLQHLCDERDAVVNLSNKNYIKSDQCGEVASEVNDIVDRYDKLRAALVGQKKQLSEVEKKVEQYNVVLHPVKETMSAVSVVLESEVPSVTEPELAKEEIVKIEVSSVIQVKAMNIRENRRGVFLRWSGHTITCHAHFYDVTYLMLVHD
jgi:hypothetical protein